MIEIRIFMYDFHFHLVFITKHRKCIFDTEKKQNELKRLLETFSQKMVQKLKRLKLCRTTFI